MESTVGRPFPPGVSGNPGGRPKGLASRIREITNEGNDLVDFVVSVFKGEHGEAARLRLEAATWLADRGFGRPAQAVDLRATVGGLEGGPRMTETRAGELVEARIAAIAERLDGARSIDQ